MRSAILVPKHATTDQEPRTMTEPSTRPSILVIDHDDDVRLAVCAQLAHWGFDVVGEDNGVSGLARLAQHRTGGAFAGLLLEMEMPVLGGMAVLQEMKDRHPSIPVIVMAGVPHIDKLRAAVRLWAHEYLVKPFDAELLKLKCTAVFAGQSRRNYL